MGVRRRRNERGAVTPKRGPAGMVHIAYCPLVWGGGKTGKKAGRSLAKGWQRKLWASECKMKFIW